MAKVSLIAKLQTDPEKSEEVEAALAATCSAAEEEAGLEIYSAHKDFTGSLRYTQTVTR